jgi:hypothetical protein
MSDVDAIPNTPEQRYQYDELQLAEGDTIKITLGHKSSTDVDLYNTSEYSISYIGE